jgi:copper chaperone NosL
MNNKSKLLMAVASLLLLLLFLLPLWKITLSAPQYPDGLKMYLNVNGITDGGTGDIANINIMNHYVGMKNIDQADFKEFIIIPYIVIALVMLGLLIAFLKKRNLILVWLIIIVILGFIGLYDFYQWEYDYGHNLDPHAAIKVPGAVYQPPLLGKKNILNFVAGSFPHLGTLVLIISMSIASFAWYIGKKE